MPEPRVEPVLVIADGGVASMVAALMDQPPGDVILWTPPIGARLLDVGEGRMGPTNLEAVREQGDVLGVRRFEAAGALTWPGGGIPDAAMLLVACEAAARLDCPRVLWPVVHGEDPDGLFAADETASLVSRVAALHMSDCRGEPPTVELPLVDLTRAQVADLAEDLNVPTALCWWHRAPKGDKVADAARWQWLRPSPPLPIRGAGEISQVFE